MLKIILWIAGLLFVWLLIAPYVCSSKSDKTEQKRLEEKKKADEISHQHETAPKTESKPKSPYVYAEPLEPAPTPSAKQPKYSREGKRHRVAGTSFHMDAIMKFAHENPDYAKAKRDIIKAGLEDTPIYKYTFDPVAVVLEPEPDNPKDPKAIKVMFNGVHIGYIKAGSCAHIHKLMQENRIDSISGRLYGGPCKQIVRYGDGASDTELEKTDGSIGAEIRIVENAK